MISSMISRFEFMEVKTGIFVDKGSHVFFSTINSCLEQIDHNPIGCRLFEKIYKLASQIFILRGPEDSCSYNIDEPKKALIVSTLSPLDCLGTFSVPISQPIHVILFHELVHAYHQLAGKKARTYYSDPLVWESDEEYKTIIGFPSKKPERNRDKITENAFRFAEGLPPRFGSWLGEAFRTRRGKLALARMRVLGMIHTKNMLNKLPLKGPPEIATCTKSDLVGPAYFATVASIEGINSDFSPNPSKITECIRVYISKDDLPCSETESLMYPILGEDCHKIVLDEDCNKITDPGICFIFNKMIEETFPLLKTVDFTVRSIKFVRLSKIEFDVLRGMH